MIQDIAPHKLHNEYHPDRVPGEDSLVFCDMENCLLIRCDGDRIVFPGYKEVEKAAQTYRLRWLFTLDAQECFWLDLKTECCGEPAGHNSECVPPAGDLFPGFSFCGLRDLRKQNLGPKHLFFTAYTALQLINWYRDNTFCGRCAARTRHSDSERALVCPDCGRVIYPRIVPAVIVGVLDRDSEDRNKDRIVLTKYAGRNVPYFALIAGFTEIGETLEETVHREVMEEVGLKVKNLRYYKSQPWAMADDILMGFYCEVDGEKDIRLDRSELKEGGWYTRGEVVLQPDDYSLTNEMMKRFKDGIE